MNQSFVDSVKEEYRLLKNELRRIDRAERKLNPERVALPFDSGENKDYDKLFRQRDIARSKFRAVDQVKKAYGIK